MDTDIAGPGANTAIDYAYRDASNYKRGHVVVLAGRVTDAQVAAMRASLSDGQFFIPGQVGLRDLQGDFSDGPSWTEDDHVWHSLESVRVTGEAPTEGVDVDLEGMLADWPEADGWDDTGHAASLEHAASDRSRP